MRVQREHKRHAEMPSLVCFFFGLSAGPPALWWRIGSGREASRGPLRRRKGSGSPNVSGFACSVEPAKTAITQPLPHVDNAYIEI